MVGRHGLTLAAAVALILLAIAGFRISHADVVVTLPASFTSLPTMVVGRVIDGDTVELADGTVVRYIGVNAPELNTGKGDPACGAVAAANANKTLVEGKQVRLEYETLQKDAYGRTLADVWLLDGELVNYQLVKEGWATTDTIAPDTRYADQIRATEQQARALKVGLFADGVCP